MIGPGTGIAPMRAFIQERYPQFIKIQQDNLSLDNDNTSNNNNNKVEESTNQQEQEQENMMNELDHFPITGPTLLFYGCRSENDDFLYKHQFQSISDIAIEKNLPIQIHVSFSRIGTNSGRYVTHELREYGENVWNIIKEVSIIIITSIIINFLLINLLDKFKSLCFWISINKNASRC